MFLFSAVSPNVAYLLTDRAISTFHTIATATITTDNKPKKRPTNKKKETLTILMFMSQNVDEQDSDKCMQSCRIGQVLQLLING